MLFLEKQSVYEKPLGKVGPCPSGGVIQEVSEKCFSKNDTSPSIRWTSLPYNHITRMGTGLMEACFVSMRLYLK